ncbi:hypothetical protein DY218_14175 [Streptomyces triticagri]|uniref:Uncharacterized protein n=1 Tax=Streptomyces triticagri TaxID=2293568 RepID=A0A372M616_9ACTN|nr:hypothetical protein DY218_14175 [Streptomyces triticagri]
MQSPRLRRKLSLSRQLGLRHFDRGATMTEYAGVLVIVALIVVAIVGTSLNETVANTVSTKVCEITGGDGCGGGDGGQNQADGPKDGGDRGKPDVQPDDDGGNGDTPTAGDDIPADSDLTPEERAYNDAQKEVDDAQKEYDVTKEDLKKAAEELIKIAGEETGITDALKCITEGDGSACTETVINALLMAAGGMPLKLAKKYLLNPKKAWNVGKSIVKNGSKVAKGLKGLYSQSKKIDKLKKKAADLKKKADAAKHKRKKKELCPVAYQAPQRRGGTSVVQAVYTGPVGLPNGVVHAALPAGKDRPYGYFDKGGYKNYVLVDKNGKVYYSGMFGGKETPQTVQRRHGKNNNRFNPANGDRMRVLPGSRTYGQSRLLEQRTAEKYKTVIGKKGKDYRGNRQNPLAGERRAEYERYETERKRRDAAWKKKNCG